MVAGQHWVSWVVLQPARGGRAPWGQTSCPTYLRERSDQKHCTELNHNERKGDYLLTAELENAFMLTARSWPMGGGDKSLDAASSSELPGRKVGMVTWHGASGANAQSKILLASIIHPFHSTPVLLVLSTPLTHSLPLAPLFSSLPRCRSHGRVSFPCFFSPFPGPLLLGGGGCSSVCPS